MNQVQRFQRILSFAATALLFTLSAPAEAAPQYSGKGKNSGTTAPPMSPGGGSTSKPGNPSTSKPGDATQSEAKFYERLDKADREALSANEGWMIPKLPESLTWVGGDKMTRDDFRGKVTVIQSIGGKSNPRTLLDKVKLAVPEGTLLLALHTPDQASRADKLFATNSPCLVAVDSSGEWCDALGVWKKPVNIVIDKTGAVRYVGLTELGLKVKLPALLAEEVDDSVQAREQPVAAGAADAKPAEAVKWPEFLAPVSGGQDMRGKQAPGLTVEKWLTKQPDQDGRLLAVDFWATWCGPCRAAIPHVNELQTKYAKDIMFVGISDEKEPAFNSGMKKAKLKQADFKYALALDSTGALRTNFFKVTGIPHMAIMSADGVVRWQGHPMSLQEEDIEKLVAANRASGAPASTGAAKGGRGWAAAGTNQKAR